jgi:hypothetical protein
MHRSRADPSGHSLDTVTCQETLDTEVLVCIRPVDALAISQEFPPAAGLQIGCRARQLALPESPLPTGTESRGREPATLL